MARDLLDLERWCKGLPARIDKAANKLAIGVVKAIDRDLVEHTPVDVTTAVSNWQAAFNDPPTFELPAIYPGEHGSTAEASRVAAIAHVDRVVAEKEPGETVYLSNLTPYIGDLNDGTSRQEPAGFFERAIVVGTIFLRQQKLGISQ